MQRGRVRIQSIRARGTITGVVTLVCAEWQCARNGGRCCGISVCREAMFGARQVVLWFWCMECDSGAGKIHSTAPYWAQYL